MTRDEIDKASGRELDYLFAIAVGWTDLPIKFQFVESVLAVGISPGGKRKVAPRPATSEWIGIGEVADEMQRQGWSVDYTNGRDQFAHEWEFSKTGVFTLPVDGPDNAANCAKAALYALLAEREARS